MIQLYAFAAGVDALPAGLRTLRVGPVHAVVGPPQDDPAEFGAVVEVLAELADAVLPARFGERFADPTALAAAVAPHADDLAEQLAIVDGCVELTVRAARGGPRDAERTDGASYLHARLRVVTDDAAAAAALHSLLRGCARDSVVSEPVLSGLLHDACYLVERGRIDEFTHCLETYGSAHPELNLVCTGPWAPASFGATR